MTARAADVGEAVDSQSVLVDLHGDRGQPGSSGDLCLLGVGGCFECDCGAVVLCEDGADEVECLRVSAGDHDLLGGGRDPADAGEVVRKRGSELRRAAWIAVAEVGVRDARDGGSQRAKPGGSGELAHVRDAGPQVVERRRRSVVRSLRSRGSEGRAGDGGAGTLPDLKIALGGELCVGADGELAGDAELAGEVAGGGQLRAGGESPIAHSSA